MENVTHLKAIAAELTARLIGALLGLRAFSLRALTADVRTFEARIRAWLIASALAAPSLLIRAPGTAPRKAPLQNAAPLDAYALQKRAERSERARRAHASKPRAVPPQTSGLRIFITAAVPSPRRSLTPRPPSSPGTHTRPELHRDLILLPLMFRVDRLKRLMDDPAPAIAYIQKQLGRVYEAACAGAVPQSESHPYTDEMPELQSAPKPSPASHPADESGELGLPPPDI